MNCDWSLRVSTFNMSPLSYAASHRQADRQQTGEREDNAMNCIIVLTFKVTSVFFTYTSRPVHMHIKCSYLNIVPASDVMICGVELRGLQDFITHNHTGQRKYTNVAPQLPP